MTQTEEILIKILAVILILIAATIVLSMCCGCTVYIYHQCKPCTDTVYVSIPRPIPEMIK